MKKLILICLFVYPSIVFPQSTLVDSMGAIIGYAKQENIDTARTNIYTLLAAKQGLLISGTTIKTINGGNLLGPGDIAISGTAAWGSVTGTLSNQTDLQNALNAKAASATTLAGYGITDGQPLNSNLTTIAGLTATTDNFIVSAASAWASRTPAQAKTSLALNLVENTALSTWAGTTNIITLGTIATGTWNATAIADGKIASALTGKTYNGLTLTSTTGTFTLTNAKTLAVNNTLTFSGTDGSALNIGTGGNLGSNAFTSTSYQPLATNLTSIGALANASGYLNNNGSGTFSYVTPSGTGDMILGNVQTVTGNKTFNAGTLISAANSASAAAHVFTASGASLKTTAAQGDMEVDANGVLYYTHAASERGVIDAEQLITLTSAYTLTSQTAAQKLFNSPTNGTVTLASNKTYFFECFFSLTAMSATSGSFGFAFGGTATLTRQAWWSLGSKTALTTASTAQGTYNTAANTTLVTANTTTTGHIRIWGKIVVGTGGTLIPQVSLGIAAAAIVGNDSYFRITEVGSNTVQSVGNWN